ncbi:MAG: NAD(P)-binding protein [Nanoarchaeota archaeon]|nr:NAD(P)-binding protein [Nanoarchaeota archaeon]
MRNVAVIGGGLTGLTCAYRLIQKGFAVDVFELQDALGGLCRSFSFHNEKIPYSPHQFFRQDLYLLGLINEFSLPIYWGTSVAAIYDGNTNRSFRLTSPTDILNFSILSPIDRLKLGLFAARLRLAKITGEKYNNLSRENAASWLRRETNDTICRNFFEPLLFNKFSIPLAHLSAEWIATRLREELGTGRVWGYIDGGMQSLIDELESRISLHNKIYTSCSVRKIQIERRQVRAIEFVQGKKLEKKKYSAIVSTVPIPQLLSAVDSFPADFQSRMSSIDYSPYIGAVILCSQKLTKYHVSYYVNSDIGGINEFTNFYRRHEKHIIYVFKYLNNSDRLWDKDDISIEAAYRNTLFRAYGQFRIDRMLIVREKYASPVFGINYPQAVPPIVTPIKGLYLAGMFSVYPKERNLDSAVMAGEKAAEIIAKYN